MTTAELAALFDSAIADAEASLRRVSEEQASQPSRKGGWLRKQELGHLLDSVQNNHQRIVLAVLEGRYEGPSYAGEAWVDLHNYGDLSWADLLSHWKDRNRMLGRVVARIPAARLGAPVKVAGDGEMNLAAWVEDYLEHMRHHVDAIVEGI